MAKVFVFADEAGNFDFSRQPGASRYFILGSVTLPDPGLGNDLLKLRRDLASEGMALESSFHATEDTQAVRDRVFALLQAAEFRFDATRLEKCKAQQHLVADHNRFYKQAWYLHFRYLCPKIVKPEDELLVVASTIRLRQRRRDLRAAIADVVGQVAPCKKWQVAFWPSESDPCLQVADYCTWAVQRKHERADDRSARLIEAKVLSDFDAFAVGAKTYY